VLAAVDARRLVLGDWTRWVRDGLDLLHASLLVGAIGFAMGGVPDPKDETHAKHHVGLFIVTFCIGGAVGAVWEVIEWMSDGVLDTSLQISNEDTVTDLLLDVCGALVGSGLPVLWTVESWGSVRRISGENRFEDTDA
jgi:hypothetical protein